MRNGKDNCTEVWDGKDSYILGHGVVRTGFLRYGTVMTAMSWGKDSHVTHKHNKDLSHLW